MVVKISSKIILTYLLFPRGSWQHFPRSISIPRPRSMVGIQLDHNQMIHKTGNLNSALNRDVPVIARSAAAVLSNPFYTIVPSFCSLSCFWSCLAWASRSLRVLRCCFSSAAWSCFHFFIALFLLYFLSERGFFVKVTFPSLHLLPASPSRSRWDWSISFG